MKKSSEKEILDRNKIPFNHWGIINEHNFDGDFSKIPIKKWDPLASTPIDVNKDYFYKEFFGNYSYISIIRGDRPKDNKEKFEDEENKNDKIDVFKPVIDGKNYYDQNNKLIGEGYSITITDGIKEEEDPFSNVPRLKKVTNDAFTIINRYPAMMRVIDESIIKQINSSGFLDKYSKVARGVNLVSVISNFYNEIVKIPTNQLADLFQSMGAAINYVITEAKNQGFKIIPISPFINHGKMVGGSIQRLHSQVYVDLNEDGHGHRMQAVLKSFEHIENSECFLCSHNNLGKIIYQNSWKLFVADSPIRNHHLRLAPLSHVRNLFNIKKRKLFLDLADIVKKTFKAMDKLSINKSRNIIFNVKPYGYNLDYHLFADIIPFEYIGGAEMSDSMRVCKVSPDKFAEKMIEII
ncbi:MAG: hypothetical protein EU549_02150 [Promethearchaeota archaeon]|nr:MAG: hypothetical protein EU549_02150 [Candidatus Lokiarchaeota archaeon]